MTPIGRLSALLIAVAMAVALSACSDGGGTTNPKGGSPTAVATVPATSSPGPPSDVASDFQVPWSVAFLPDGSALISERPTALIHKIDQDGTKLAYDLTDMTRPGGEGGLLGLAVSPAYATDSTVYAYLTAAEDNRVVRLRPGRDPEPILTGIPKAGNHNGGRIAFGPDGMLYVSTGDAGRRDNAQDLSSLGGKILRLRSDGSVPEDNPFPGSPVWTLGHRNVQGIAWDAEGRMWATEFGQNTYDEVNLITAGANYGWPVVEGRGGDRSFTDPVVVWPTSDASPSGAAVAGGVLYVGALRGESLWAVPLGSAADGRDVGEPVRLLQATYGRIRDVTVAPDGSLWLTTSNRDGRGGPHSGDDRIVRVWPTPCDTAAPARCIISS